MAREVGRTLRELSERHIERRLRSPDLIARLRAEPIDLTPASPAATAEDAAPDVDGVSEPTTGAGVPDDAVVVGSEAPAR